MNEPKPCPICGAELQIHGPEDWKPSFYDPDSGGDPYNATCDCGFYFSTWTYDYTEFFAALNRRTSLPDNKALTVEGLREMIGGCAWCKDTDGINPGLLCLRHGWDDFQKEVHIWLLDEEGNTGVYDVEYMIKCGAKFYRRPPVKEE